MDIHSFLNSPLVEYTIQKTIDLLSFLFQASIAGLVVLFFTEQLRIRRENENLKKYCLLVQLEVKKHSLFLSEAVKSNLDLTDGSIKFRVTVWNDAKINLIKLPRSHIKEIASYYEIIDLINDLQASRPIELKFLLLSSIKIQYLLLMYSDEKNKKKHNKLYLKYKSEAESNEMINSL